jgi:hypothetical protein
VHHLGTVQCQRNQLYSQASLSPIQVFVQFDKQAHFDNFTSYMGRQVHYFTCDRLSYVLVPFAVVDLISFCGGAKNDIWVLHIICSWAVRAPPPCCSVELMSTKFLLRYADLRQTELVFVHQHKFIFCHPSGYCFIILLYRLYFLFMFIRD